MPVCVLGIETGRHASYSNDGSDEDEGDCGGTHLSTTATRLREQLYKETNFIWAQALGVSGSSNLIQILLRVPKYTSYHGGNMYESIFLCDLSKSFFNCCNESCHDQSNL